MTEKGGTEVPTNDEIINEITQGLQEKLSANDIEPDVATNNSNEDIPYDFQKPDQEPYTKSQPDDYIDEEKLKIAELNLTDEEKERMHKKALELKNKGNDQFKSGSHLESVYTYTEALKLCPLTYVNDRSIFYANRAASKISLDRKESAIEDCSKAIELNDKYLRAYLRRAKLYEEMEKLDESLADYKQVLEFDKANKEALHAEYRLAPLITEKNEKLKTEMLGKLKDLGNMVLKPFGLSTENFQLKQDPNSGGYSVNFTQNK